MQPNPPPPYGAPIGAPAYTPAPPPQGNGIAVAAMVLGILSILLCFAWFISPIIALLAIIFGALGLGKAKKIGGRGKGMALAGLITGIVGMVIGIFILVIAVLLVKTVGDSFEAYATKAKQSEATLQLYRIERDIKTTYMERSALPASAPLTPDGEACGQPNHKFAPVSEWTGGWAEMGFRVDEPSYFQYRWTKVSETEGYAEAIGDLDCDGEPSTTRLDIRVIEGNITAEIGSPTPD